MKLFGLEIEKMNNIFKKISGLMFRKTFDTALIFDMEFESVSSCAIHSYFVNFPFEVIFLDSKKKIVDMKTVVPWQLWIQPKKPAQYIIEIPKGIIKKQKLNIGGKLVF